MDVILYKFKWQHALLYFDDNVIFSKSIDEHIKHKEMVLRLLKTASGAVKLQECALFTIIIDYLGHSIRPGRLEVANRTAHAIHELKVPTKVIEQLSISGLCNVFRKFLLKLARIVSIL